MVKIKPPLVGSYIATPLIVEAVSIRALFALSRKVCETLCEVLRITSIKDVKTIVGNPIALPVYQIIARENACSNVPRLPRSPEENISRQD
jgi:hypothetical protein